MTTKTLKQALPFLAFLCILGFRFAHADPVDSSVATCDMRVFSADRVTVDGVEDLDLKESIGAIIVYKTFEDEPLDQLAVEMVIDGGEYDFSGPIELNLEVQ